ncbi:MAG: prepilin-type N-terminal cleavage/methylation domain-containing protein [Armatimonadota bacterium]
MRTRSGFTLIELLVVIAIISILASILLPVFATAREKGRQTVCLSNMHQIGMAIAMQSIDIDGQYPGAGWVQASESYLKNKSIYTCPSDPNRRTIGLSYELNVWLMDQTEGIISDTSSTILLIESGVDDGIFDTGPVVGNTVIPMLSGDYPATSIPNPISAIHTGRANAVYADGHAKSVQYGQLTAEMFFP